MNVFTCAVGLTVYELLMDTVNVTRMDVKRKYSVYIATQYNLSED